MIYEFLADGFEIIEAMAPVDMLRRAKIDVRTIGVGSDIIEASNGTKIVCDDVIENVAFDETVDGIILPGGMPGTLNLEKSKDVQSFIDKASERGKLICAICAAPSILGHKGLLDGKEAIAFPGFENDLKGAKISDKFVVTDGNIITAKGAGSATEFGLEIVSYLSSKELSDKVKSSIRYYAR